MVRPPARARRPPQRFSPDARAPLPDDYAPDEHDDVPLDELSDSDVTSIADDCSEASDADTDLSGFVVSDGAVEEAGGSATEVEAEWSDDSDDSSSSDDDDDDSDSDDEWSSGSSEGGGSK